MTDHAARTLELTETAPLSEQLVRAVADREGVDPVALETPLHEAVDPDALDRLFRPTGSGDRPGGRVTFRYHGYRVVVSFADEPSVRLEAESASPGDESADLAERPSGDAAERASADGASPGAVHFCLDCGWRAAGRDGHSAASRSRMALDHYVRTGHTIDSCRSSDRRTDDGSGRTDAGSSGPSGRPE